jgi:4'-phosphopantetheinyl transferase EntD
LSLVELARVRLPDGPDLLRRERAYEFAMGRACAARVLRSLGSDVTHLPVGDAGEPIWPSTVRGSIAHDAEYACAVGSRCFTAVGVDIELTTRSVAPAVFRYALGALADELSPFERFAAFSFKEAVVKAAYVRDGALRKLREIALEIDVAARRCSALVSSPNTSAARRYVGEYEALGDHVVAWAVCTK